MKFTNLYNLGGKIRIIIFFAFVLTILIIPIRILASELEWSTNEPSPEKKWSPKPDILKVAFKITKTATDIKNLQIPINICREYLKANPNNIEGIVDAYLIIAQSYFNIGDFQSDNKESLKTYEKSKNAAQKVIELAPGRWDGWFWSAVNLGRIMEIKGIFKSLFIFGSFKKHIFKAKELAPNSPFVLNAIGHMYREIPSLLGGSIDKSKDYLEKAVKIDPHFTAARIDLALTLLKDGKKEEAIQQLKTIINEESPTWEAHYKMWDKPKAEQILKENE